MAKSGEGAGERSPNECRRIHRTGQSYYVEKVGNRREDTTVESMYTVQCHYRKIGGIRIHSLAVYAGSRGSYEEAEEELKVWRGLEVSHETIRMLCHQEAPKVKKFVEESAEVPKGFIAAAGNVEITIDASKEPVPTKL